MVEILRLKYLYFYLQTAGIFFVIIWLLKSLWKFGKLYWHARHFSGPLPFPFIGNIHIVFRKDIVQVAIDLSQKYPSVVKLWLGPHLIFLIDSIDYTEKVLNNFKLMQKHFVYDFIKLLLGTGLINSSGQMWRQHRKIISPSFNQKMLESFIKIFEEKNQKLVGILENHVGVKNIKLYHILCRCTLESICETSMEVKTDIQKSQDNIGDLFERIMKLVTDRILSPWLYPDFIWKSTQAGKDGIRLIKTIKDRVSAIIGDRRKLLQEDLNGTKKEKSADAELKRIAILDVLLEDSVLTENDIQDELRTFIVAGTETTAGSVCFVAVILGLFPNIQEKVYDEIIEVCGAEGSITSEQLSNIKYTERVIKETMRIFPTIPFIARKVAEDVKIGDKVFPASSGIAINILMLHRNPKYWPDPLKFDPDRFLPEEIAKRSPYAYMPFSLGPRMCIGWKYAMLNMKSMLVAMVRNFKIHTEYKSIEEINVTMRLVLRMVDGSKLWLEKRKTE